MYSMYFENVCGRSDCSYGRNGKIKKGKINTVVMPLLEEIQRLQIPRMPERNVPLQMNPNVSPIDQRASGTSIINDP